MYIIGLTGGIACGKSAVASELAKLGAKTFDVDKETHKLLQCGGELYSDYVRHFGSIVVDDYGELNRKLIADIIFNNEAERLWINSVAHPVLLNRTRDFLVECAEKGVDLVILEIPLLFEAGWEFLVDEIWAVYINRSKQIWRLTQRDNITRQEAEIRVNAQMSAAEIAARADAVINNKRRLRRDIRSSVLEIAAVRLSAFLTIREQRIALRRAKKQSEVVNLENQTEIFNIDSSSDSDNLRGDSVAADTTDFVPVPVS